MTILAVIVVLGFVVAMIAPTIAKRRVLGKREKLADEKLLELFSASSRLSGDTILVILKTIGSGYGVDYSALRPDDCLVSRLSKIDSWRFDAGAEKLEKLLKEKYGVAVPEGLKTLTILDLLKLVEIRGQEAASLC